MAKCNDLPKDGHVFPPWGGSKWMKTLVQEKYPYNLSAHLAPEYFIGTLIGWPIVTPFFYLLRPQNL